MWISDLIGVCVFVKLCFRCSWVLFILPRTFLMCSRASQWIKLIEVWSSFWQRSMQNNFSFKLEKMIFDVLYEFFFSISSKTHPSSCKTSQKFQNNSSGQFKIILFWRYLKIILLNSIKGIEICWTYLFPF